MLNPHDMALTLLLLSIACLLSRYVVRKIHATQQGCICSRFACCQISASKMPTSLRVTCIQTRNVWPLDTHCGSEQNLLLLYPAAAIVSWISRVPLCEPRMQLLQQPS